MSPLTISGGSTFRGVTAMAAALLLLATVILLAAPSARASPRQLAAAEQQDSRSRPEQPHRLRLEIDTMSPRIVRSGDGELTISGTITNTGDRRITDLVARVELGRRIGTDQQARQALSGPLPHYRSRSRFTTVSKPLKPGESSRIRLRVPLNGSDGGLSVRRPGVYPLLVNVNGTPDFGGPARLVAANLMLPVLDVPEGDAPGKAPDESEGGHVGPLGLTVLWPIRARHPTVLRDVYGKPLLLADDSLAKALAPGGRLNALVTSATDVLGHDELASAMCFAVDPALVSTVAEMADGYRVRTSEGDVAGKGQQDAKRWLESLRQLVDDRCVVHIPYSGADLNTLPRIGSTGEGDAGLVPLATGSGDIISRVLRVRPLKGVLWPSNRLGDTALGAASDAGVSSVITSAAQLSGNATSAPGTTAVEFTGSSVRGQTFDPLLHRAFTGTANGPGLATQNGLGTLVLRMRQHQDGENSPVVLAPPQRWSASPDELRTFLSTLAQFARHGRIDPVPLRDSLRDTAATTVPGDSNITEATSATPGEFIGELSDVDETASKLTRAMAVDATAMVRPEELVRPLRQGVLRATSTAWPETRADRATAVRAAQTQVNAITSQVTVSPPPQPIALASEDSPLPVYISNKLPVTVTVEISLLNNGALRPEQIPHQKIPANSSRNRNIDIDPLRAGHIAVRVQLSTPDGVELGEPERFELVSTQYGTITLVVTAAAGAALLMLSGRRIYRRLRGRRTRE